MMTEIRKIGVLTSGGDAPGMNAAIRAVVRAGVRKGIEVVGVKRGYNGLMAGNVIPMTLETVSDIVSRGGTILHSARSAEYNSPEGVQRAHDKCVELGIDGIVVIGGDGSYRGALDLSRTGIKCIGIPGTIDNDIGSTDYSIGFDTASNTAVDCLDKLMDTIKSHDRVMVAEVMGRNAGYLALNVGIGSGATAVLIPEVKYDLKRDILDRLDQAQAVGKHHALIVMAEGVGKAVDLVEQLKPRVSPDLHVASVVLGHIQRGGTPSVQDRVTASQMGYHAIELLTRGIYNRVIGVRSGEIVDYDIELALQMKKSIDVRLYEMATDVSL